MFRFNKCRFINQKYKDGTSRSAVWKIIKTPAVYTLETSLCGASINSS